MKIRKLYQFLSAVGCSTLLLAGAVSAQPASAPAKGAMADKADKAAMATKSLSDTDRDFMIKAAGDGLYEIEVSKLAAKKAQRADVKRFAAMLVKDHTAASEELTALAVSKPLRIPRDMPDGKKADLNRFLETSPEEFDAKYLQMVGLEDHRADVKAFEEQVQKGSDPQLKAFATKTLVKLKAHLAAAEKLASNGAGQPMAK